MTKNRTFQIVKVIVYAFFTFNFITLFTLSLSMCAFNSRAQSGGVAINSTGGAADNSAMLDVSSINQGMRI
ncbi:MAG: hypothetical protein HGB12_14790, partial [Bacteroidetes bacterium]|nr:hypothetical protein [Bacteroidota bacterium]